MAIDCELDQVAARSPSTAPHLATTNNDAESPDLGCADRHSGGHFCANEQEATIATPKQPIGPAAAPLPASTTTTTTTTTTTNTHSRSSTGVHLATFVGCPSKANSNTNSIHQSSSANDVNTNTNNSVPRRDSKSAAKSGSGSHAHRGSTSQQQQAKHIQLQATQSQTRINHSLESINSRYSTSSANDDSTTTTASMQHKQQQQQQQRQQHLSTPGQQQQQQQTGLQPRLSLRQRLSIADLSNSSPIEAQLASSTCDLGINLLDGRGSWRGSFSALGSEPATPLRDSARKSVAATFVSLGGGKRPSDGDTGTDNGSSGGAHNATEDPEGGALELASKVVEVPKPPFMFAGVLASIVGSVFFSLSVLCIKLLPNQEGFGEKVKAVCFRGLFVTFLCGVAIIVQRSTFIVRRDELLVNVLRAVFGTTSVLGLYCSLNYISMGDATALIFSSPVWTSILSHFILGEPLQWLQLVALPASLFGIVLIAHPGLIVDVEHHAGAPANESVVVAAAGQLSVSAISHLSNETLAPADNQSSILGPDGVAPLQPQVPLDTRTFDFEHRWPGIAIALGTSLLVSSVYIALKFRKKTPIQTTTFWFGMFMIFASLTLQCFTGPIELPASLYEWALLFGNGVTSWLGQSFLQWAFLYEEAGVLSIVRTLDVAMTFMLSSLFLDEEIIWTSIVGATIIGLVVASIMLNEWIKKLSCFNGISSALDDGPEQQQQLGLGKIQARPSLTSGLGKQPQSKQSPYVIASKA